MSSPESYESAAELSRLGDLERFLFLDFGELERDPLLMFPGDLIDEILSKKSSLNDLALRANLLPLIRVLGVVLPLSSVKRYTTEKNDYSIFAKNQLYSCVD